MTTVQGSKDHSPMRIRALIDGHMLGEQEGGNETYVAGLVDGFSHLYSLGTFDVTILCGPHYQPNLAASGNGLSFQRLDARSNWGRVFRSIPAACRQQKADLIHVTYNASPLLTCPVVVSVHDVIFRIFPEYFSPRVRILLSTLLPLTMMKAKRIITLSQTSKADIEKFYPFTKGKIDVTLLAPGPIVNAIPDYSQAERYTLGQDFLLSVGTVQPRKNISRLIQGYIAARTQGTTTAKMVVVGRAAWQHSEIHRMAVESGYAQDIVFTGYLSDEVVAALYRRCLAFIYPSLYEGFGLPVIEAMACGAPVVTSNCSSLPEVAGNAAILVDPYSIDAISDAIKRVSNCDELRQALRAQGSKRADGFSWQKTAQETLAIYEQSVHDTIAQRRVG